MIEKNGYIIVEKGDTLGAISSKVGMSTNALKQANPSIKDINKIYVNQKIKTKPKEEPKSDPEKENKTSAEEGEKAINETKSEPEKSSDAAKCCCMITRWIIKEKGRNYNLEVVKDEKLIKQTDSDNNKLRGHTLNIVTSPVDKDGKATFKEITTKHKFKRNICDLVMTAKQGKYELTLKEDDTFKINSHGSIVDKDGKAIDRYIEPEPPFGTAIYKIATPDGSRIKTYKIRRIPLTRLSKNSPRHMYPDHYENRTLPMSELESYPIFEKIPTNLVSWDFGKIFNLMFKPIELAENIIIYPTGEKCPKDKSVTINVTKPIAFKGAVALTLGKESLTDKRAGRGSGGEREMNNASQGIAGALEITHGTHLYVFGGGATFGGGSSQVRTKGLTKYDSGKLFKGGAKLVTNIYDITAALNRVPFVGYKSPFSFTPGVTKFEITTTDLKLVELPDEHILAWDGKITFGITLFDGATGKLDLIPYITAVGGAFGKLLNKIFKIKEENEKKKKDNPNDKSLVTGTLELYLTLEASLGGELSLEMKSADKNIESVATLGGKVVLKAIGRVDSGINIFKIEAKAGAVITMASAKSINDGVGIKGELKLLQKKQGKNPGFEGDIICTGAGLYYACYTEIVYKDSVATGDKGGEGESTTIEEKEKVVKAKHDTKDKEFKTDAKTEDKIVFLEEFSIVEALFNVKKKKERRRK